ncbi:MAG TPA: GAF domain-containing protein, partial [Nitrospiria bacterium]|nr:GAF domain-containing protein [Nitrospiria bacterium]
MSAADRLKKRYQAENKKLRTELAQRTRELSFFINSAKALTSTLEINQVIQAIMKQAQRLIKCDAWSLLFLEEDYQQLRFVAVKGEKTKKIKDFRMKVGEGIAGWVAQKGKPLMVNDIRKDPRFDKKTDKVTRYKTRSVLSI